MWNLTYQVQSIIPKYVKFNVTCVLFKLETFTFIAQNYWHIYWRRYFAGRWNFTLNWSMNITLWTCSLSSKTRDRIKCKSERKDGPLLMIYCNIRLKERSKVTKTFEYRFKHFTRSESGIGFKFYNDNIKSESALKINSEVEIHCFGAVAFYKSSALRAGLIRSRKNSVIKTFRRACTAFPSWISLE